MSKLTAFIIVDLVLVLFAGIVVFKNFKNFGKSLYWLIYPNIISIWSKKRWDKDFNNTFRFELFLLLAAVLIGLNILVFKFLL
jgi:hypothetical protein